MYHTYHNIPYYTILYHTKTIPYHTIPYTLLYHTKPYDTIIHHTIPYYTIIYHNIAHYTIQYLYLYHTIPFGARAYHTFIYNTTLYSIFLWHPTPYHTAPYYTIYVIPYHTLGYLTMIYHTIPAVWYSRRLPYQQLYTSTLSHTMYSSEYSCIIPVFLYEILCYEILNIAQYHANMHTRTYVLYVWKYQITVCKKSKEKATKYNCSNCVE